MSKKNKPHAWRSFSSFFNPLIQPTFTRDVANENPQNQSIVQPNIANENHPPQSYVEQILPGNVSSEIIESYSLLQPNICVQWQTSGSVRPACTGASARNILELQQSPKAQNI